MEDLKMKMKLQLNSVYGVCASGAIAPTLTDEEIIQKIRKQIRLFYRYIEYCEVENAMYQYGRVEGFLYGLFAADRLSMEDYEKFSYVIECMDNEFFARY